MPGTRFLVHWFILCACLPVECNGMREPKWVLTIVCIVAACRGSFYLHTELYTVQSCATYTYFSTNFICILNLFPQVACFLYASIHDASVTVDRLPFSKAFMWVCLTCLVWFPRSRGFVKQHFLEFQRVWKAISRTALCYLWLYCVARLHGAPWPHVNRLKFQRRQLWTC